MVPVAHAVKAAKGAARPTCHRGETLACRSLGSAGKISSKGRGRKCTARASRRSLEVGFPSQTRGEKLEARGTHIICELSGCDARTLTDLERVRSIMVAAAEEANAEILKVAFHRFQPQGVSGVVVIAESHLSIHTWPEAGYAAVDFYTCGDHTDPWRACEYAAAHLGAQTMLTTEVKRGITSRNGQYTHVVHEHAGRSMAKRSA
jgi:S-adenosylmethionine decarboxylase